jgi:hypothetical protein
MTRAEFDEILKQNDISLPDSYCFDHNEGWFPLVAQLIKDLKALGWDGYICQAKEKFGGLRFYINEGTDEMFELIDKAERDSFNICEDCGGNGKNGKVTSFYFKTLCDDCRTAAKQFYKEQGCR